MSKISGISRCFVSALTGVIVTAVLNYFFPLLIITIEGKIVDSENKHGIENARILLKAGHIFHKVASDQDGKFRIPDVRRGTYILKVNADAYGPASKSIQTSFQDLFPFNFDKTKGVGEIKLEQSPLPIEMVINGEVKDIFDNPRKGVMVIIDGIEDYSITDKKGRYYFSNVPHCDHMTLKAYYGEESASRRIEIAMDTEVIEGGVAPNAKRKTVKIKLPLVLEHPKITLKACLCKRVEDREPQQIFEEENPDIPTDIGKIWCFVRIFGPFEYEQRKKTQISYEWYWKGQLVGPYS